MNAGSDGKSQSCCGPRGGQPAWTPDDAYAAIRQGLTGIWDSFEPLGSLSLRPRRGMAARFGHVFSLPGAD